MIFLIIVGVVVYLTIGGFLAHDWINYSRDIEDIDSIIKDLFGLCVVFLWPVIFITYFVFGWLFHGR